MNEQILMKLAEMEKKRGFKQKLKDNAWTIGLGVGARAPSVGFAIDQQRRNIKKEKATGEKPKSLIERRPGVVSGAVMGGVVRPLLRTVMRGSRGGNTSLGQLATEMIGGAAGGALGGALIVDPLTRWGTRKYYQHRDKEMERAIRNRIQEGSLQKEAAYGDTVKNLGRKVLERQRILLWTNSYNPKPTKNSGGRLCGLMQSALLIDSSKKTPRALLLVP